LLAIAFGFGLPFVVGLLRRGRDRGLLLLPSIATALFIVWLAAANMKPFNVRYLAVVAPAFWIWVAMGITALPRRLGQVVLVCALAASAWSSWNYFFVPRYGRDDVRGAARFVAAHAGPTDPIVQIALTGALRWYYDDLGALRGQRRRCRLGGLVPRMPAGIARSRGISARCFRRPRHPRRNHALRGNPRASVCHAGPPDSPAHSAWNAVIHDSVVDCDLSTGLVDT
jgi:hypothetical protein